MPYSGNLDHRDQFQPMKRSYWLLAILVFVGCVKVLAVRQIPEINLGEATFFRTIEAHTDAPIGTPGPNRMINPHKKCRT
jgi:hypothetical protein